nr:MAG TPA: hypothetical protein [Caudoviricetes sp.]
MPELFSFVPLDCLNYTPIARCSQYTICTNLMVHILCNIYT